MKNQIKIKEKGILLKQKKSIIVLSIVCSIAFLVCILLELLSNIPIGNLSIISFIQNTILSVWGGGIISLITILLSYLKDKNNQVKSLLGKFDKIYFKYKTLHQTIHSESNKAIIEEFPEYHMFDNLYNKEKRLYKNADDLLNEIEDAIKLYENSDFTSTDIDNIIIMLNKLQSVLSIIQWFAIIMLPKDNPPKTPSNYEVREYTQTKPECYTMLYNEINEIITIDKVERIFEKIMFCLGVYFKHSTNNLQKALDLHDTLNKRNADTKNKNELTQKIISIKEKYCKENFQETSQT